MGDAAFDGMLLQYDYIRSFHSGPVPHVDLLVRFIDDVAVSSTQQTDAGQQASSSMRAMVQVFEQFTDLLLTSGDELTHMRQVVAELQASVAGLRVGDVPSGQVGLLVG